MLDGSGTVGAVLAEGKDRSDEGEKGIVVDGVNETIWFDSKGFIGGSMVTEGCLVDRSVEKANDSKDFGDILAL